MVDHTYLENQPNLRPTFAAIGFDCLLDINEKICPIFVLQFYKSVRLILNLNGTLSIAFIIRSIEITLRIEKFAHILRIPCRGVYPLLIRDALFDPIPPGKTHKEIILSENAISLTGNKDHPNACLCYMLYCLATGNHFNLAYYIVNRMDSVTKSADMTLPYGMLLTRLVEHIRVSYPHAFLDDLYLVDHVMIPLSERRVFRIIPGGKRPQLPTLTPTPSGSSESTSSSSHQEEKIDPVNNFTLDPIPYINQLPPFDGGESSEFKQTKGMFKCLGHFLSNLKKKKKKKK
ncbi:hypothetical protein Tco_0217719 [Tanacetum coccineum]